MVVGIVQSATAKPGPIRKWMSGLTDVRSDERIGQEVMAFLKQHGVKQVVSTDGLIGALMTMP